MLGDFVGNDVNTLLFITVPQKEQHSQITSEQSTEIDVSGRAHSSGGIFPVRLLLCNDNDTLVEG